MTGNITSDDDLWIEDEIQQELAQLDDGCLLTDDDNDDDELYSPQNHLSSVDAKVLDAYVRYFVKLTRRKLILIFFTGFLLLLITNTSVF